jgi:hypothetical protein
MISGARAVRGSGVGARGLIDALAAAAPRYTSEDRREKLRLLGRLAESPIRNPRALGHLHETLCFLQAYPDDGAVLGAVDRALAEFPARVKRLGPAPLRRLNDSGIAGTTLDYPFGFPMARWLATRFPRDVDVLWEKFSEAERLQDSLFLLLHRTEHDGFSDEGGLGWRRWLEVAKGGRALTDLQLLLDLFDQAGLDGQARDWLFESLALPIGWRLDDPGASRTFARLPWPRPYFHAPADAALARPSPRDFISEVTRPLPSLHRASRPLAESLIEAARRATATRLRELFAFAYANPDDVLVADPGRGLRIALIGLLPEWRLPFEGYYAYLALKNGVPVGYGAGWQLFDAIEVAVNVFESFRRGESAFIVGQVFRAYHQALGMHMVVVDPYQIGQDNPEALKSGAFYFYQRLGFRPRDPAVLRLSEQEQEKIARDRTYRTPLRALKELARSEIYLPLSADEPDAKRRITASRLATLVTDHVARRFRGDRRRAGRDASARVAHALRVPEWTNWPRNERRAFEDLALVLALIPDLARWPAADRRRLVQVIKAKGGASEARYVKLLATHHRLRRSLDALLAASHPD